MEVAQDESPNPASSIDRDPLMLRVLVVSGRQTTVAMVRAHLAAELGSHQETRSVETVTDVIQDLCEMTPSCVLVDVETVDARALAALRAVAAAADEAAVVALTAADDPQAGFRTIDAGAHAYVATADVAGPRLVRIIQRAVETKRVERVQPTDQALRPVLDGILDPVFVAVARRDGTGAIIDFICRYANTAACKLLQLTPEGLLGRRASEVAASLDPQTFERLRDVVIHREPFRGDMTYHGLLGAHQADIDVEVTATPHGDGFIVTVHDLSARLAAQEAARAADQMYRALVESAAELVLVVDTTGYVRYANEAVVAILGDEPHVFPGTNAFGLVHPDDRGEIEAAFRRCASRLGSPERATFRARHAVDGWQWVDGVAVNRVHDPAIAGVVLSARPVPPPDRGPGSS